VRNGTTLASEGSLSAFARSAEIGDDIGPLVRIGRPIVGQADTVGDLVEPRLELLRDLVALALDRQRPRKGLECLREA
jgi:hypothetical protein